MYQYIKRQLKTPTCFGSFEIHPQEVLKVFHWNYLWCFVCVVGVWQREIWTYGVCVWCDSSHQTHTPQVQKSRCQTPTTHTKISQVISVKHVQHSVRMDFKGSETCRSF